MVEEFCKKHGLTIDQFYGREIYNSSLWLSSLKSIPDGFNPVVAGNLLLSSLTSIPKGLNPIVGGSLNLCSLKSIPEGFNPVVGGNLWLDSLTSIPKGFNPVVGGNIYYDDSDSKKESNHNFNNIIRMDKGYIKVAGIFGTLLEETDKYFKIKEINNKELYICYKDNIFGYGEYLPDAIIDLKNKLNNI